MKFTNFLIIALILTLRTCQPEIVVATSKPNGSSSEFVENLVTFFGFADMTILRSCYGDRLKTVGLAGRLPDALPRTLSNAHLIPIVLLDDAKNYTLHSSFVPVQFRRKIHVFVIEASTPQQLDIIIQMNIKSSIWWNHLASFLIVDRSLGCLNAGNFLWTAWYRDVLHAKVLCYGNETGKTVYNYNPYTHEAPVPWQHYTVMQGVNGHPFTVFYQKYRANESICLNLDFEKTKNLGGYEIRVDGPEMFSAMLPDDKKNYILFFRTWERVQKIIARTLNGTSTFSNTDPLAPLSSNGDIKLCIDFMLRMTPRQLSSNPIENGGYVLISKFRGNKPQLDKIIDLIDMGSWIGLGIVYLITLIFFKFFIHKAIIPAILDTIRIICNTGLTNLTGNIASRIYVGCLLLFTIIMQVAIQCDLATLLTTNIPLKNIKTMEDVERLGYKVCVKHRSHKIFQHEIQSHVRENTTEECYDHVMKDSSFVFYDLGCCLAIDLAQDLKLHVSPEFVTAYHATLEIRWNWALEQPVNRILRTLVEANQIMLWENRITGIAINNFQYDETIKNNPGYKPLELREVGFVFGLLGIGLVGATVSFIFELVIGYKCKRNRGTMG